MKSGRKRWWLAGAAVVLALTAGGWILLRHSDEPRYQGRPLSYWFKQYYSDSQPELDQHPEPADALRAMGTNALPYLVRQAFSTRKDTALLTNYNKLREKLPDSWPLPRLVSRETIRDAAAGAIGEIGPPADSILPLLREALDSTNADQHEQALDILGDVKEGREKLVLVFARALHYPEAESQQTALDFLEQIGAPAKAAVPDLIEFIWHGTGNRGLRLQAVEALGSLGPDAAAAVPILLVFSYFENTWDWRVSVATALCQIDGRQTNALNFIVRSLKEDTGAGGTDYWGLPPKFRKPLYLAESAAVGIQTTGDPAKLETFVHQEFAIYLLGVIGTNAAPAIPDVIEALEGTNQYAWIEAGPALVRMGAPKELFISKLEGKLNQAGDGPRALLALRLMSIDPKSEPAQSALIGLIQKGSPYGQVALYTWRPDDKPPREMVPVLRAALESGKPSWSNTAARVLRQIEAQEAGK